MSHHDRWAARDGDRRACCASSIADGSTQDRPADAGYAAISSSLGHSIRDARWLRTYFLLGVDHILLWLSIILLFVFALGPADPRPLDAGAKTITAFTVAHSLTLAGASLGYFSLPQKPVEATIALSIAFVAGELVKTETRRNGGLTESLSLGRRLRLRASPWLRPCRSVEGDRVAADAISRLALFTFNLGVEAGQLMFVAAVLLSFKAVKAVYKVPPPTWRMVAAYGIGTISTVWLVSRVSSFS